MVVLVINIIYSCINNTNKMTKSNINLEQLPKGAPWLTERKEILRNPNRFQRLLDSRKWSESFLEIENMPYRKGERPITFDEIPHQMYTQQSSPKVLNTLVEAALKYSKSVGTVVLPTKVSFYTTQPAFFIPEEISIPEGLLEYNREHAHIHAIWTPNQLPGPHTEGTGGGSMHVSVSHADAQLLIERGWAEWHPMANENFPIILLYAPQNMEEIELSMAVIKASYEFLTNDIKK